MNKYKFGDCTNIMAYVKTVKKLHYVIISTNYADISYISNKSNLSDLFDFCMTQRVGNF